MTTPPKKSHSEKSEVRQSLSSSRSQLTVRKFDEPTRTRDTVPRVAEQRVGTGPGPGPGPAVDQLPADGKFVECIEAELTANTPRGDATRGDATRHESSMVSKWAQNRGGGA